MLFVPGGATRVLAAASGRRPAALRCAAWTSLVGARAAHTRSEPVKVPSSTSIEILDFAPQPRPTRPLSALMRKAKTMVFKGPKGEIAVPLHYFVKMNWGDAENGKQVSFAIEDESVKVQRGIWGLTRALAANAVKGVEEGHTVTLRLVGVGYRATLEPDPMPRLHPLQVELERSRGHWYSPGQRETEIERAKRQVEATGPNERLNLRLGYSHPVILPVPFGVKARVPQPTQIELWSVNKELVGQFAQDIRRWRPPEPYKGKGVFVGGESIRLKTPKKK